MKIREKRAVSRQLLLLTLVLLLMLPTVLSCGSSGNNGDNGGTENNGGQGNEDISSNDEIDAESTTEEEKYVYPEMSGDGGDFTFLSPTTTWFYYTSLVHDSMTGDVLDDAIYTRNRFIEDKFNINIKEISLDINSVSTQLRKVVLAGEDSYDAAYCPAYSNGNIGALITQGLFYNLRDIPSLNLDENWWNQTMAREAAIGGGDKLFYAGCDINIMTLQTVSCVYFNQDMITNLGLELPYKMVKEGKWTFDVFNQYIKSGARLNGAESFSWDASGEAIYGLVSYEDSAAALCEGSGERFIVTDANGMPQLAIENERFINVLTKIQEILQTSDGKYLYANDSSSGFHYEPIFKNGRALMAIGELKAADVFKDMDATFGILPIPKYDENQADYYSHLIYQTPVLVIPVTNTNTEFAGAVLDSMAYVSNRDVTPVLFDVSVSQKRLRNEDSIDMLQIIKNSGSFDVGCAYGWTTDFYDYIRNNLGKGIEFEIVSKIEQSKDKINSAIAKTMELFE